MKLRTESNTTVLGEGGTEVLGKFCVNCGQAAFESGPDGRWSCRRCRVDLTELPYVTPDEIEQMRRQDGNHD
jgi:ribosomal protein S27AE